MAKVISIANQKGGVGKTTTTENLAAALTLYEGCRVLAVDYDPQCSLTKAIDHEEGDLDAWDVGSGWDLSLGDPALAARDFERVSDFWYDVEHMRPQYDVVLIDCPPSLSMVTMNALFPADHVIIPTQASYLAAAGIEELVTVINTLNQKGARIQDVKVLLTMYERNGAVTEMEKQIREAWPTFDTVIRKNVTLSYAQAAGVDVYQYDQSCNSARDYEALAHEMFKVWRINDLTD